jgi:hypothetical protein
VCATGYSRARDLVAIAVTVLPRASVTRSYAVNLRLRRTRCPHRCAHRAITMTRRPSTPLTLEGSPVGRPDAQKELIALLQEQQLVSHHYQLLILSD